MTGNLKIKEGTVQKLRKNLASIRDMLNTDPNTNIIKNLGSIKELVFNTDDVPYVSSKDVQVQTEQTKDQPKVVEKIVYKKEKPQRSESSSKIKTVPRKPSPKPPAPKPRNSTVN